MRFASDNSGPVHPEIMKAIETANSGWDLAYGNDELTQRAADKVRDVLEAPDASVFFVPTGTAANALLLATLARPFQTVFCTPEAHIHEDECNAPEFFTGGAKLTLIPSKGAKMCPEALQNALRATSDGDLHHPQPGPVSLTQLSERGTLYSLEEIRNLSDVAHRYGVKVHMDGARFANAVAAEGCSAADMTWRAGIDALSFGGTKNGCMAVEAAVLFDPALARDFELYRKRAGHLFSKQRYLAAQVDTYLSHDLWFRMASDANSAAERLETCLRANGVDILHTRGGNMLYASLSEKAHRRLREAGATYAAAEHGTGDGQGRVVARLVCDWSCPDTHIDQFADIIAAG